MEKEGQEAKFTNSPGKEKKRGKLPDFFRSFQLDRRGKWTWRTVTVCVLYLLKRRNTWLNLFHLSCNPTSSKLLCLRLAFTRSLLFHSGFFHSSTSSSPYLILSFWSDTEPFEDKCKLSVTHQISQVRHIISTLLLLLSSFDQEAGHKQA